jgi:hypothetical protein
MSFQEVGERFDFASQRFYSQNPDASPFALDGLIEKVNEVSEFNDLDPQVKEFIETAEYEAFKDGETPSWFVQEEYLDEDAPLTEEEKLMLKGTE